MAFKVPPAKNVLAWRSVTNPNQALQKKTKREYHMGNHKLKSSDCEKDIGIHVDEHLSFDTHINYIVNKGLLRPQLEYATSARHPHLIRQM